MGISYVIALVTAVMTFVVAIVKKDDKLRALYFSFSGTVVVLLLAIIFLLQKTNEGGRHIWLFAFVGIILACVSGFKAHGIVMKAVVIVLLAVFCVRGSMVPTDYDIPIGSDSVRENVEYWQTVFDDDKVFEADAKGYDNTVIWVFIDYAGDSGFVTEYSELYALPAGMGISCCYPDYVSTNIDSLKSRYIITDKRGDVAGLCGGKGFAVVAEYGNTIMFKRTK